MEKLFAQKKVCLLVALVSLIGIQEGWAYKVYCPAANSPGIQKPQEVPHGNTMIYVYSGEGKTMPKKRIPIIFTLKTDTQHSIDPHEKPLPVVSERGFLECMYQKTGSADAVILSTTEKLGPNCKPGEEDYFECKE